MKEVKKQTLAELPWLASFKKSKYGNQFTKSALLQGDKIGCYDNDGNLVFMDRNLEVGLHKKVYVLMLAKQFPKGHPKAGESTGFFNKIVGGEKIHTIRNNYPLWESRIEQINSGFAVLSVRGWTGNAYRSKQIEIMQFEKLGIQKMYFKEYGICIPGADMPDDIVVAKNDGLSEGDFDDWLEFRPTEPMAIIHFTDFRYE